MNRPSFAILLLLSAFAASANNAISSLLDRIDPGLSEKIIIEITNPDDSEGESFVVTQQGWRPKIEATDPISAAVGVNTYLRKVAGVHLGWNMMHASLPDTLPAVASPITGKARLPLRYYLNYCTHSYSAPFWDQKRWQEEIDWMALHGINMPLAITGSAALWRNVLTRLGFDRAAIDQFIAGPGYQAWWLMNNLEGWGGPNSDEYYDRDLKLQQFIAGRMREFGMEPVLPGYSGMLPSTAAGHLGLEVSDPGLWCGFTRPSFLQPQEEAFDYIANIYYDELTRLYGLSRFYSMDPFHEGGSSDGVDLAEAGRKILNAMKRANPEAAWVAQGWQENPRAAMVDPLPYSDVILLDLQAENQPMWRLRPQTFANHPWIFCQLLNFGGNVGLYGKMEALRAGLLEAIDQSRSIAGIGLTMEGIENNPVMFDMICDWIWSDTIPTVEAWIADYAKSRYGGVEDRRIAKAWQLLSQSVYNCPAELTPQGTTESLFCARPQHRPTTVSAWANSKPYYDPSAVVDAARLMLSAADRFANNPNFRYDLVDITRQAAADHGRELLNRIADAADRHDRTEYQRLSSEFLDLILLQDSLLGSIPDFRLGRWTEQARNCASTATAKDSMEWNARTLITVWGPREAADGGRLHDYSHREWQGLLRDLYHARWKTWFDACLENWDNAGRPEIDFFEMERAWADQPLKRRSGGDYTTYSATPEGDPIAISKAVIDRISR